MKIWKGNWLIFLLFVNACGPITHSVKKHQIDQEFTIFVENFEHEIEKKVDIDIKFNTLKRPTVGVCFKYSDSNYNYVEIDSEFWYKSSFAQKEQIIFHELGHCILNRQHNDILLNYNQSNFGVLQIPKSIMYPNVFEQPYELFRSYYVSELKNSKINLTDYLEFNSL